MDDLPLLLSPRNGELRSGEEIEVKSNIMLHNQFCCFCQFSVALEDSISSRLPQPNLWLSDKVSHPFLLLSLSLISFCVQTPYTSLSMPWGSAGINNMM